MHSFHFSEDAYILFTYVRNFLDGYGITYYPNGEPIEGATDFLWLMLLIALSFIGFDIGSSAIFLNGLSIVFISAIFLHNLMEGKKY